MKEFIVFDIETSGLDPHVDRIVELAAIRFCEDGSEVARFSSLVNPQIEIPEYVTDIHGITNEMVISSPSFSDINSYFTQLTANAAIAIAHNAKFDVSFINQELKRCGLDVPIRYSTYDIICSMSYAKHKHPFLHSYSLPNLVKHFNLPPGNFHRAIADCEHTKNLWLHLWRPEDDLNDRSIARFRLGG